MSETFRYVVICMEEPEEAPQIGMFCGRKITSREIKGRHIPYPFEIGPPKKEFYCSHCDIVGPALLDITSAALDGDRPKLKIMNRVVERKIHRTGIDHKIAAYQAERDLVNLHISRLESVLPVIEDIAKQERGE